MSHMFCPMGCGKMKFDSYVVDMTMYKCKTCDTLTLKPYDRPRMDMTEYYDFKAEFKIGQTQLTGWN